MPKSSITVAKQGSSLSNNNIHLIQSSSSTEKTSIALSAKSLSLNRPEEQIDQARACEGNSQPSNTKICTVYGNDVDFNQLINTSQLHQSRLGLLSQALMMIITVGFLFSETLEEFWKTK